MKILLISPFFAPENQIASHRITKFAEYWAQSGHEVTVITRFPAFEGMETPDSEGITVHRILDPLASKAQSGISTVRKSKQGSAKQIIFQGIQAFTKYFLFPDHYVFWAFSAKKRIRDVTVVPDVVVTSVGPLSALIIGKFAANHYQVPLVVDYRDLISDRSIKFRFFQKVRSLFIWKLETRLVRQARLISAVTEPMRTELESRFDIKSELITNGYEPRDFDKYTFEPDPNILRIAYVGSIYPGKRDPSPLIRALALLSQNQKQIPLALDFYGKISPEIVQLVDDLGLHHLVFFHGTVSHDEAVKVQINADVLLLLYWNHPSEEGVYTGKLFEYIGAKRPILCMGLEKGIGPNLIHEQNLGKVLNSPIQISEYIQNLLIQKANTGKIPGTSSQELVKYTREAQSNKFISEIENLII